jgi:excisionase family DNA binding protein
MKQEQYYSTTELAGRFGVTRQSVWNWIRSGRLKASRLGIVYRVAESDWETFIHIEHSEVERPTA